MSTQRKNILKESKINFNLAYLITNNKELSNNLFESSLLLFVFHSLWKLRLFRAVFLFLCVSNKAVDSECYFFRNIGNQIVGVHADLLHAVAVADGHRAVLERRKIDRNAVRRTDLVLTAVAFADRPRLVVNYGEMFFEFV